MATTAIACTVVIPPFNFISHALESPYLNIECGKGNQAIVLDNTDEGLIQFLELRKERIIF